MRSILPRPKPIFALVAVLVVAILILWAMGRPGICTCATMSLWGKVGPTQSQMLADWYSPSHMVHGFLFYAALAWLWRSAPVERRFIAALLIETAWEIAENTPMIIDRYREATMAFGFLFTRRLPVWASVAIVVLLELVPLIAIRDNLSLNVWMLLAPNDAVLNWQAAGA